MCLSRELYFLGKNKQIMLKACSQPQQGNLSQLIQDKNRMLVNTGKLFAIQRDLSIHIRSHKGEKSFACSHCGKLFIYQNSLTNHI